MIERAVELLKRTSLWHLLWISLFLSETLTFIIVSQMSLFFHGNIRNDFIVTGAVSAFFASVSVTLLIIVLVKKLNMLEGALVERGALYQRLVELAPDAVVLHSGGKIIFANPAARELVGARSSADFIGKPILDFVHPDSREAAANRIAAIMRNKERAPVMEEKIIGLDGSTLDMEVQSTYIEYDGNPSVMTLARDISVRKRAAEAIIKAKEEAEAASRSKSEFLSNISHELRTPLSVSLGFAQLLGQTKITDDQKLYVAMIESSNDTLLTLINDLLDFTHLERGRFSGLKDSWVNLKETVEKAAVVVSDKATRKGLEFHLQYDKTLPIRVRADPSRLSQIIASLADNAVKFTEAGGVGIIVAPEGYSEAKAMIRFTIHDSGVGIPEEKQDKIFESFTQADGSLTRKHGGLGLGTSISKLLVNMMGGRIWVESQPGSGSKFHFAIPFHYEPGSDVSGTAR
ncbi:MAG: PAS domain S-box protein [Nitrospinae bacterium]|nr:PAS domain S-box protein [Nitrospinota bacterium]